MNTHTSQNTRFHLDFTLFPGICDPVLLAVDNSVVLPKTNSPHRTTTAEFPLNEPITD